MHLLGGRDGLGKGYRWVSAIVVVPPALMACPAAGALIGLSWPGSAKRSPLPLGNLFPGRRSASIPITAIMRMPGGSDDTDVLRANHLLPVFQLFVLRRDGRRGAPSQISAARLLSRHHP
jgi:hypothetical protein